MLNSTIRELETSIPQMISFSESQVDYHSWERWANASYVSDTETDVDLMALLLDMLGNASVPAMFGRAFLTNNPHIVHDVQALDKGMMYFLLGLPRWTPWVPAIRAHWSRSLVWESMNAFNKALDAVEDGKEDDAAWGDLDDVSPFIRARNKIFRGVKLFYSFVSLVVCLALTIAYFSNRCRTPRRRETDSSVSAIDLASEQY